MRSRTFPPKQVVDRRIESLADNIPQRHLDSGLGLFDTLERLIHLLHNRCNAKRIFSDHDGDQAGCEIVSEKRAAAFEYTVDLAEAGNAAVGLDENDGVIGERRNSERGAGRTTEVALARAQHRDAADIGDFHRVLLVDKCSELSNTRKKWCPLR